MIDNETLDRIWNKALKVKGLPPQLVRMDVCGALIVRNRYSDRNSDFGWEIDHIYPAFKGGDDNELNLRPMQWRNNQSKGSDYPVYFGATTANDTRTGNIPFTEQYRVSEDLQEQLKKLYE